MNSASRTVSRVPWIYLIALVPTLTEYIETGNLPNTPSELLTDLILGALLGLGAFTFRRQQIQLAALAETDALTGLLNSRRFNTDLPIEVARARRLKSPLVLVYLDLDDFKLTNDTKGHVAGDEVLTFVGGVLQKCVRQHVDHAYRLGGDEFALILVGAPTQSAMLVLERVRESLKGAPHGGAAISFGTAELAETETIDALIKRADADMYSRKRKEKRRRTGEQVAN